MLLALASPLFFFLGWAVIDTDDMRSPVTLALGAACSALGFASFAFSGALLRDEQKARSLGLERPRAGPLGLAVMACGLLGWSLLALLAIGALGLQEHSAIEKIAVPIRRAPSGPALWMLLAVVSLGAGVVEELLFRGLLLRAFTPTLGVAGSALATTALFAAFHMDAAHSLGAAVLGIYLAGVRIATGSTLALMLCHVLNNAVAVWTTARGGPPLAWSLPAAVIAASAGTWLVVRGWREGRRALLASLEPVTPDDAPATPARARPAALPHEPLPPERDRR